MTTTADVAGAYNDVFTPKKRTGARTSRIVDPPNGRLPSLTPEWQRVAHADPVEGTLNRRRSGDQREITSPLLAVTAAERDDRHRLLLGVAQIVLVCEQLQEGRDRCQR